MEKFAVHLNDYSPFIHIHISFHKSNNAKKNLYSIHFSVYESIGLFVLRSGSQQPFETIDPTYGVSPTGLFNMQ